MSTGKTGRDARGNARKTTAAAEARTQRSSAAVKRALRGESVSHDPLLSFSRTNYLFMAAGVALAIVGFMLLRGGDISFAPLLLVLGYCALIPLGIIWRDKAPGEPKGPKSGE